MVNEKLKQVAAQGKTIEIDGTDFRVEPMQTKDFLKAQIIGENKDKGAALIHMIHSSLDEDVDKTGLREAPAKVIMPLQTAIEEVNDFEDFFDEDEKQEALDKLQ